MAFDAPGPLPPLHAEWLETDGLGGFAMGTVGGLRTRRYHALLQVATNPPTGRMVLVNGLDAWIETEGWRHLLTPQAFANVPGPPDASPYLVAFHDDPWPCWVWQLPDGIQLQQEVLLRHGQPLAIVRWRATLPPGRGATLHVRPLLSGRDYHHLHLRNREADLATRYSAGRAVSWQPYVPVPRVHALAGGDWTSAPEWLCDVHYVEEAARGLDCVEDLIVPGSFRFDLVAGDAWLLLTTQSELLAESADAADLGRRAMRRERDRRRRLGDRLHRSADQFLVARAAGRSIIAGYPWFTDWGRDTFVALDGLCFATGRLNDARLILETWAASLSDGLIPNHFPDHPDAPPADNSVDASLWFVVAAGAWLRAAGARAPRRTRTLLVQAILAILRAYIDGTRHQIHLDHDGLVAAPAPGVQLTWMDARIGDWIVTPRAGKPVEVQALWYNALLVAAQWDPSGGARWQQLAARTRKTFAERFWNAPALHLNDVVDPDGRPGGYDPTMRPSQILAVGGLPHALIEGARARAIVDACERDLLTAFGLRTLAPGCVGYCGRCEGDVVHRDSAYHQGTVWPWLMAAFVDAWLRVRGETPEAMAEARVRFLPPLREHLHDAGLGHVSEIFDGDPPHTPRGCPFQAWSLAALLRLEQRLAPPAIPES